MKNAFQIVSEAKVAFEKACTDLSSAVRIHKGVISKKEYEAMAVKHLSIIHEVLVNSESDACSIDKALAAYDAPEPEAKKNTFKAGTTMAMEAQAREAGYTPKGKRCSCPGCKSNNTLVTLAKGNETVRACKCGYRKPEKF